MLVVGGRLSRLTPVVVALALSATARAADPSETISPARERSALGIELLPQISIVSPTQLTVQNSQYVVPYSESIAGMPAFAIGAALPVGRLGNAQIDVVARTGLGMKTAPIVVKPKSGGAVTANMTLAMVPFSGAAKFLFEIPGVPFVKPVLELGGGVQWLHQSGNLPGLADNFWIPYVFATPGLNFLAGSDWFGGFTFGVSIQQSVGSNHTLSGWSFDLGLNIFL
jgi:hypothetical protein